MFHALEMEAAMVDIVADRVAAGLEHAVLADWHDELGRLTRDQLVAEIRKVAAWEREWVTALEWTDTAYAAWRARLDVELQTNPVARVLMPALDGSIERTRATVVRRALVLAAARVYQEGPGALTQVLDPASGQPFVYRYTAGGFELESSYRYKDETIRYTFPNR